MLAGDVTWLPAAVQCSQDINSTGSLFTTPVFYACGSRLFKCQTIHDVNLGNNNVVRYGAGELPLAENADNDVTDTVPVIDRICPYCSQIIASSVSPAEYERHVQAHLESGDDDDDDDVS